MAATKEEIRNWLEKAKLNKYKYLLVVCDTYDYDDYPIYCEDAQKCRDSYEEHDGKNMQRVMEVYDLSLDFEEQLAEYRAHHLPIKA